MSNFLSGWLCGMGAGIGIVAFLSMSPSQPQPESEYIPALGYDGAWMGITLTVDWEQYKRDNNIITA